MPDEKRSEREVPCPQGKIERFIEPCLLLLLSEQPSHGYELIDQLEQFGIDPRCQDPGQIYRYLRRMENEGLVKSSWQAGETGPARRSYRITSGGTSVLAAWMRTLEHRMSIVGRMLARYREQLK